jgi:hypothetical protein
MAERPGFQRTQYAFTAHIRDPQHVPLPEGVEDRRMAIYRELLHNNLTGFVANAFPVLHQLYDETAWAGLMRDFFARHQCRSPYFREIPEEFLRYLSEEHEPDPADPPYLQELAHYEWIEMAAAVEDTRPDLEAVERDGDLLEGVPVRTPLSWLLTYAWPVHRISPEYRPEEPGEQPTFLLVYRDLADRVGFMELNPVTARLLQLLEADTASSGRALLERIALELGYTDLAPVLAGGAQALGELRDADIVLGTRR